MTHLSEGPRGRRFLYELLVAGGAEELSRAVSDFEWKIAKDDGSRAYLVMVEESEAPAPPRFKLPALPWFTRVRIKHRSMLSRRSTPRAVPTWKENVPPGDSLITSAGVADLIRAATPDPSHASHALTEAVAAARYWQEPDATDLILSDPVIVAALAEIDDRPLLEALEKDRTEPFAVLWGGWREDAGTVLETWLAEITAAVERAQRERPADVRANWSGMWHSTPPYRLLKSQDRMVDGVPTGLTDVEDGPPRDRATVLSVRVKNEKVYVVDSAQAWVALCTDHPLDVTAEVRHDWYRVTGRDGTWIIPNWRDVARDWDGVLVTPRGYLTAAGRALPAGEHASVLAGWNPGETFWLRDCGTAGPEEWRFVDDRWEPVRAQP